MKKFSPTILLSATILMTMGVFGALIAREATRSVPCIVVQTPAPDAAENLLLKGRV